MKKRAEEIVGFHNVTSGRIFGAVGIDHPSPAGVRDRAAITPGPTRGTQPVRNSFPAFHFHCQGQKSRQTCRKALSAERSILATAADRARVRC